MNGRGIKFFYCFLFLYSLVGFGHCAEDSLIRKKTDVCFGVGYIQTHINYNKNYLTDSYTYGYEARLSMRYKYTRFVANVEYVKPVDMFPTWIRTRSTFFDLDMHKLLYFKNHRSLAYFILGATVQYWRGYYTGLEDIPQNIPLYRNYVNKQYSTFYPGITIGFGAEVVLYHSLCLFGEFRFRIAKNEIDTRLNDQLYSLGLKTGLSWLKLRRIFRKPDDIYHWF